MYAIPDEPPYSCPNFDDAIDEINKARDINTALRDWGEWYKEAYEKLKSEFDDEIEEKNKEIKDLRAEIYELYMEIKQLQREL